MTTPPANPWISGAPVLMSLSVFAIIGYELRRNGLHAPHPEEAAADQLALLLVFGQIPIFVAILVTQRKDLWNQLPVMLAQVALWALTFCCVSLT